MTTSLGHGLCSSLGRYFGAAGSGASLRGHLDSIQCAFEEVDTHQLGSACGECPPGVDPVGPHGAEPDDRSRGYGLEDPVDTNAHPVAGLGSGARRLLG